MKNGKNKNMSLLISICVVLLYFVWPYFVGAFLSMLKLEGEVSLFIRLISNFFLLFLIMLMYSDSLKKQLKKYKKDFKKLFCRGGKIFLIGFLIYTIFFAVVNSIFPEAISDNTQSILHIFDNTPVLLFFSAVFYYPIVEELVFKKTFKDFLDTKWSFVLVTAVINGAFEVMLSYSSMINLVYVIPTVVFYGTLSYMYYETDNVWVPITYRMLYNLIPCIGALMNVALILL